MSTSSSLGRPPLILCLNTSKYFNTQSCCFLLQVIHLVF
uniref:Uncharacterized protein n=1 Tax=Lepeophtheirus salmonis TaxID=72036 RepID=A0A0K2V3V6_LEPSM